MMNLYEKPKDVPVEDVAVYYCPDDDAGLCAVDGRDYGPGDLDSFVQCDLKVDTVRFGKPGYVQTLVFDDGSEHDCLLTGKGVFALSGGFLPSLRSLPLDKGTVPVLWCEGAPATDAWGMIRSGRHPGRGSLVELPCRWGKRRF